MKLYNKKEIDDLIVNGATDNQINDILQLWREIIANNILFHLGKLRNIESMKIEFKCEIEMLPEIIILLDKYNAIAQPLRLANTETLINVLIGKKELAPF